MLFKLTYKPTDINEVQNSITSLLKAVNICDAMMILQSQGRIYRDVSGLEYMLVGIVADD